MYPSKLSDDDLYDRYLDPDAYDNSPNTTFPSFDAHSPYLSSYEPPTYYTHASHTIVRQTSHTFASTDLDGSGSETGAVYLSDRIGVETELHPIFGSSHEEQRTEDDVFGRYQAIVSQDIDRDFCAILKAENLGDAWCDHEPYTNSVEQSGDSATPRSPSQDHPIDPRKRFVCGFCDKTFTLQHDRLRHVRTLHRQEEDYVYRCAVSGCAKGDKIFNRLDNFRKHLKTTHRNESPDEIVKKSRTSSGDTFTVVTPEMYSCT
ncbi:hypothetical protein N0V90_001545 [Kalmusia sp. IMI 367209]|nr:hypothetical protein N0V90_001545 [Kalmusia sp. IMI 367209]